MVPRILITKKRIYSCEDCSYRNGTACHKVSEIKFIGNFWCEVPDWCPLPKEMK